MTYCNTSSFEGQLTFRSDDLIKVTTDDSGRATKVDLAAFCETHGLDLGGITEIVVPDDAEQTAVPNGRRTRMLVITLPEEAHLTFSQLFTKDGTALNLDGYIDRWIKSLKRMRDLVTEEDITSVERCAELLEAQLENIRGGDMRISNITLSNSRQHKYPAGKTIRKFDGLLVRGLRLPPSTRSRQGAACM